MTDFCIYSSYIMIGFGAVNFLSMLYSTAPYGKYSRDGLGWKVNAKMAWFLQELPSFVVPLFVLKNLDFSQKSCLPGIFMVGLFLLHYFHR